MGEQRPPEDQPGHIGDPSQAWNAGDFHDFLENQTENSIELNDTSPLKALDGPMREQILKDYELFAFNDDEITKAIDTLSKNLSGQYLVELRVLAETYERLSAEWVKAANNFSTQKTTGTELALTLKNIVFTQEFLFRQIRKLSKTAS